MNLFFCKAVRPRLIDERKNNRPWYEGLAFFAGSNARGFESFEVGAGLLPIADGVVRAEGYLLAAGKQKFLAALHQILLIEGPRVHEILQHNHNHTIRNVSDLEALR